MGRRQCFICGRSLFLENTVTVGSKGIATFIKCSKKYKDNKFKNLLNCNSVKVHDKCRKRYCKSKVSVYEAAEEKRSRTSGGESAFDFKKKCIICGEDASEAFFKKQIKKPIALRDNVHLVETLPFKNSLISAAQQRNDVTVLDRLHLVSDLVAVEARYHKSCSKSFFARKPSIRDSGRPEDQGVSDCLQHIVKNLEENREECQFTLPELLKDFKGHIPSLKALKTRLKKKYGDEIIFSDVSHHSNVMCFRDTGYKILTNSWYEAKTRNPQEERHRVVAAAAAIIREDIRSTIYPLDSYPKLDSFLESVDDDIPESLKLLQNIIMPKKCRNFEQVKTKVTAISHAVISASRPRSFNSSIQIGLGAMLYKKYGSKDLIEILSSLGYCCSYYEAKMFEASCIRHPIKNLLTNSFSQFIFDNADINIDTIDGHNTFHAMGGIQCITPQSSVRSETRVCKLSRLPSATASADMVSIPLVPFQKTMNDGLKTIVIHDMNQEHSVELENILPTDFLWMYTKWNKRAGVPGWNGFMENVTSGQPFQKCRVLCLPFLNFSPGKHDTIYSVLLLAVENSKASDQECCIVTFDQPLYFKARDIVASSY